MSEINQPFSVRFPGAQIAEGAKIHESCRIEEDAEISAEAVLGSNVVIGKNAKIIGKVKIDRAVIIHKFSTLFGPLHIAEGTIIGPGVVVGLVQAETEHRETRIMESCRVGRASQILAGLQVGRHARIRAGSLVIGDVPHYGLASQNPAVLERYACPKCSGQLKQVRMLRGAIDTQCEDCGAGEYRFANQFWTEVFNRVLLPDHTIGSIVPQIGTDPGWSDIKELG